jgi:hypothetical protein
MKWSILFTALSAMSFVISGVYWIKAASVSFPTEIDLGVLGGPEPAWIGALRRSATRNSRAALFAAIGAAFACAASAVEVWSALAPDPKKSSPGPPPTLGSAAVSGTRIIVWCCGGPADNADDFAIARDWHAFDPLRLQ